VELFPCRIRRKFSHGPRKNIIPKGLGGGF